MASAGDWTTNRPPSGQAGSAADSPAADSEAVGTGRIEAFSDGVFAIAITLLVLDVKVPEVAGGLSAALRREWPAYLSFVMSFVIIGIIWAQHHQMFRHIKRTDHVFLLINVAFLMWIASLPFPTALLSTYLGRGDEQTAMAVYAGWFVVGSLFFQLLWRYATSANRLIGPDVDRRGIARISGSYRLGLPVYLIDFGLAFVSAPASLVLFLLIAVFYAVAPIVGFLFDRDG